MAGYKEDFLHGIVVPLPSFSAALTGSILKDDPDLRDGMIADYIHYSVVMNHSTDRRSPAFVALNIDQKKLKTVERIDDWRIDDRIGFDNQLDNAYYADNPWDRGHMARRATAAWGSSFGKAQRASNETFYYSNSCLQHKNLNRDEWLGLEDWVYKLDLDADDKITSFSGPFYGSFDRTIKPSGRPLAVIPAGFFKVVCFKNKDSGKLDVRAFAMYQDAEALKDMKGRRRYNNQTYQVTISEIEQLTGLVFDDSVFEANPLYFSEPDEADEERRAELDNLNIRSLPERHEVARAEDMLRAGDQRNTVNDDTVNVFIAAAMVDPTGGEAAGEWISLANLSDRDVDVSAWKLEDNQASLMIDDAVLPAAERLLKPGQSCVVGPVRPLRLSNKGDVIKLFDAQGDRIDWVNYTKRMVKEGEPVLFLSPRDTLV